MIRSNKIFYHKYAIPVDRPDNFARDANVNVLYAKAEDLPNIKFEEKYDDYSGEFYHQKHSNSSQMETGLPITLNKDHAPKRVSFQTETQSKIGTPNFPTSKIPSKFAPDIRDYRDVSDNIINTFPDKIGKIKNENNERKDKLLSEYKNTVQKIQHEHTDLKKRYDDLNWAAVEHVKEMNEIHENELREIINQAGSDIQMSEDDWKKKYVGVESENKALKGEIEAVRNTVLEKEITIRALEQLRETLSFKRRATDDLVESYYTYIIDKASKKLMEWDPISKILIDKISRSTQERRRMIEGTDWREGDDLDITHAEVVQGKLEFIDHHKDLAIAAPLNIISGENEMTFNVRSNKDNQKLILELQNTISQLKEENLHNRERWDGEMNTLSVAKTSLEFRVDQLRNELDEAKNDLKMSAVKNNMSDAIQNADKLKELQLKLEQAEKDLHFQRTQIVNYVGSRKTVEEKVASLEDQLKESQIKRFEYERSSMALQDEISRLTTQNRDYSSSIEELKKFLPQQASVKAKQDLESIHLNRIAELKSAYDLKLQTNSAEAQRKLDNLISEMNSKSINYLNQINVLNEQLIRRNATTNEKIKAHQDMIIEERKTSDQLSERLQTIRASTQEISQVASSYIEYMKNYMDNMFNKLRQMGDELGKLDLIHQRNSDILQNGWGLWIVDLGNWLAISPVTSKILRTDLDWTGRWFPPVNNNVSRMKSANYVKDCIYRIYLELVYKAHYLIKMKLDVTSINPKPINDIIVGVKADIITQTTAMNNVLRNKSTFSQDKQYIDNFQQKLNSMVDYLGVEVVKHEKQYQQTLNNVDAMKTSLNEFLSTSFLTLSTQYTVRSMRVPLNCVWPFLNPKLGAGSNFPQLSYAMERFITTDNPAIPAKMIITYDEANGQHHIILSPNFSSEKNFDVVNQSKINKKTIETILEKNFALTTNTVDVCQLKILDFFFDYLIKFPKGAGFSTEQLEIVNEGFFRFFDTKDRIADNDIYTLGKNHNRWLYLNKERSIEWLRTNMRNPSAYIMILFVTLIFVNITQFYSFVLNQLSFLPRNDLLVNALSHGIRLMHYEMRDDNAAEGFYLAFWDFKLAIFDFCSFWTCISPIDGDGDHKQVPWPFKNNNNSGSWVAVELKNWVKACDDEELKPTLIDLVLKSPNDILKRPMESFEHWLRSQVDFDELVLASFYADLIDFRMPIFIVNRMQTKNPYQIYSTFIRMYELSRGYVNPFSIVSALLTVALPSHHLRENVVFNKASLANVMPMIGELVLYNWWFAQDTIIFNQVIASNEYNKDSLVFEIFEGESIGDAWKKFDPNSNIDKMQFAEKNLNDGDIISLKVYDNFKKKINKTDQERFVYLTRWLTELSRMNSSGVFMDSVNNYNKEMRGYIQNFDLTMYQQPTTAYSSHLFLHQHDAPQDFLGSKLKLNPQSDISFNKPQSDISKLGSNILNATSSVINMFYPAKKETPAFGYGSYDKNESILNTSKSFSSGNLYDQPLVIRDNPYDTLKKAKKKSFFGSIFGKK